MDRELVIEFRLPDADEVSPSEFVGFFSIGEQLVRDLAFAEALRVFSSSGIEGQLQFEAADNLTKLLSAGPVPAKVVDVRHSSPWIYVLHIPAFLLAAFVTTCLMLSIKEAWTGSTREKAFRDFFRNHVFGGAATELKESAARSRSRSRKGLKVADVKQLPESTERSQLFLVITERTRTIEASISDRELLDSWKKKLGNE